ncbi:gibberellin-regulated protein 11-like [Wolffia australiana]
MAPSRVFLLCLFFSLLASPLVMAVEMQIGSSAMKIDCGSACNGRCKLSSRPNLCKRACGTCCSRCNCVPPGTAGNKEVCPCYARLTTRGGVPKCP